MKNWNILVAFALVIGLISSVYACDNACETAVLHKTAGDITYITGGVGLCEVQTMQSLSSDYPLNIVFIQKLGHREEFLADVKVQIFDRYRHLLLDIATEGPYLFMALPQGKYLMVAEYDGDVKKQWVSVGSKGNKRIVFWWPILQTSE
jgi:hypothetical protein